MLYSLITKNCFACLKDSLSFSPKTLSNLFYICIHILGFKNQVLFGFVFLHCRFTSVKKIILLCSIKAYMYNFWIGSISSPLASLTLYSVGKWEQLPAPLQILPCVNMGISSTVCVWGTWLWWQRQSCFKQTHNLPVSNYYKVFFLLYNMHLICNLCALAAW